MTEEELRPCQNVLPFNHFDGILSIQDYFKNKNQASCSLHVAKEFKNYLSEYDVSFRPSNDKQ